MKQKDKNKTTIEAYNKNAHHYAEVFNNYGIQKKDIDRALKLNKSDSNKILELGCGNGRDAEYLISEVGAGNYIGIDASTEMIALAKEKNPAGTFHVKGFLDYFNNIQTQNAEFGAILAFYSMLHVNPDELKEILYCCHKYLKIGGILYISSKYGEYRELEIENFGDKKYYYLYKPEDLEELVLGIRDIKFETVYKIIRDSDYGPAFTIALRKV
jgi:SAM-dependent methyltransferase